MSVIEGIGDEVLYMFLVVFILLALYLSWLSTSVSPSSFTYVVAIDNALFSNIFGRFTNNRAEHTVVNDASHPSLPSDNSTPAETTTSQNEDVVLPASSEESEQASETVETTRNVESQSDSNETDSSTVSDTATQPQPLTPTQKREHADNVDGWEGPSNEVPLGHVRIRLQYIDGKKRTVFARPDETIGEFKRRNFSHEISSQSIVRFIMGGRELKNENTSLQLYNVKHDDVIHCLVSNVRPSERPSNTSSTPNGTRHRTALDVGSLVFPIFGLALALTWYARIFHRGYFNGTSTFSLVAITFLYIMSLLASYRMGSQNDAVGHLHQE